MKFRTATALLSLFWCVNASTAHHEEAPFPWKYSLSIEAETQEMNGLLADSKQFADSGVLQKRGASMSVYQINAGGYEGANVLTEFYYPDAASLPSPNVMVSSQAHLDAFGDNQRAGDFVRSTIYKNIHGVIKGDAADVRVFMGASIKALTPDYVDRVKSLLAANSDGSLAYGINEVIAGGHNGETHVVWWGYASQTAMLLDLENTEEQFQEAQKSLTGTREILRTVVNTSLLTTLPN